MISIGAKIQTPHLNPFLKIPNPNHDLKWSKSPNPKITISALERHGFDDLDTGGIFSIVGLCFQFFLLHLNLFLKIPNQIKISIGAKTVFCGFVVHVFWAKTIGSYFLGKKFWREFHVDFLIPPQPRTSWKSNI